MLRVLSQRVAKQAPSIPASIRNIGLIGMTFELFRPPPAGFFPPFPHLFFFSSFSLFGHVYARPLGFLVAARPALNAPPKMVSLTVDGKPIEVPAGSTILQVRVFEGEAVDKNYRPAHL